MSVTTSDRINQDRLDARLPAGAYYTWTGEPLEASGEKTLTATGMSDSAFTAAINQAVAAFTDYDATRKQIRDAAAAALAANQTYLGHAAIPGGTLTLAQLTAIARTVSDQVDALTRQTDGLIRLLTGDFSGTTVP